MGGSHNNCRITSGKSSSRCDLNFESCRIEGPSWRDRARAPQAVKSETHFVDQCTQLVLASGFRDPAQTVFIFALFFAHIVKLASLRRFLGHVLQALGPI